MVQSNIARRKKRIVLLLVVIIISIIGIRFFVNHSTYNRALDLYDSGKYEESIEAFDLLGDYLDSEEMILEANYNIATDLLNEKKYDQAMNLFISLDGFKDSEYLSKRCIYLRAKGYANNNIWSLAVDTISAIPEFLDSDVLKANYTYNYALDLAKKEEWESAINIMEPLGDYLESETLLKSYKYNIALGKYRDGDWQSASDILSNIKGYRDSEELSYQFIINDLLKIDPIYPEFIATKDNPISVEDFEQVLLYMAYSEDYIVNFSGSNYDEKLLREAYENLDATVWIVDSKYVEIFSQFDIYTGYYPAITIEIRDINGLSEYKDFRLEAYNTIMNLIEDGRLTADMSQKDKAKELYKWVAQNLIYDYDFDMAGYTGYGALFNRKATCNGYTALYNMLCKIVGIEVVGVMGDVVEPGDHIWTLANLDGEEVYIDITWGDPSRLSDYTYDLDYFAVDDRFMSSSRTWDREIYNLE